MPPGIATARTIEVFMADDRDDHKEHNDKPETPPIRSKGGSGGGSGPGGGGDGNMRFSRSMLGWILILSIAVLIFVVFHNPQGAPDKVTYTTFVQQLKMG